jgi:hypothetical protein
LLYRGTIGRSANKTGSKTGRVLCSSAAANSSSGGGFGTVAAAGNDNTGQFSIKGQRESANGFSLNGVRVQETIGQQAGIIPNLDSIAEFRILTSNTDAEYGSYSGGLINVVTRSGGNRFHGPIFEFLRNTNLDAKGFVARAVDNGVGLLDQPYFPNHQQRLCGRALPCGPARIVLS